HIAFLFILLLLVFGAKRLPELRPSLGAGMRGVKESITGQDEAPQLDAASVAAAGTATGTGTGSFSPLADPPGANGEQRALYGTDLATRGPADGEWRVRPY
ncbi:MAG: twin-arginine translocase TatA/TatE family subunit, partial [Solirubrobacterales bacterium]|nr:twin-arginine translocase TatA/TatE family subunit [Solirubrobacterales bacterium]